ncbi:MAG: addiction module protein [Chromatiaceae bacterium]|jgi:putative addiction module component (TIGR02574 family)
MGKTLAFQLMLDRVEGDGALVVVDKQIAFAIEPPRAFDRKGFKGFGSPGFDQGGGVLDQPEEVLVVLVRIRVEPLRSTPEGRHADETSVLEQALALPAEQRLRLVDALLSSLNAPTSPEVERAWREEAERRVGEIETGRVRLIEGEEAFARLRAKYRQ